MQYLFILNDSPYGSQRTYNGLRLAINLTRSPNNAISIFLLGDGVTAAFEGFSPAHVFYNTQEMLRQVGERGARIGVCKNVWKRAAFSISTWFPPPNAARLTT
jgi:uncharacterized protein involved in oxidation of intracellular sulfur